MDDVAFDRLVRALARPGSRRGCWPGSPPAPSGWPGWAGPAPPPAGRSGPSAASTRIAAPRPAPRTPPAAGAARAGRPPIARRRRPAARSPAPTAPASPRYWDGYQTIDPLGFPGIGCCGDHVCHNDGTCNVNRPPVALDLDVKHPWQQRCIPVTLIGYDPDNDAIGFELVVPPRNGFLTEYLTFGGTTFAKAAPPAAAGVRAMTFPTSLCGYREGSSGTESQAPCPGPDCICPDCFEGGTQNIPRESAWRNAAAVGLACRRGTTSGRPSAT